MWLSRRNAYEIHVHDPETMTSLFEPVVFVILFLIFKLKGIFCKSGSCIRIRCCMKPANLNVFLQTVDWRTIESSQAVLKRTFPLEGLRWLKHKKSNFTNRTPVFLLPVFNWVTVQKASLDFYPCLCLLHSVWIRWVWLKRTLASHDSAHQQWAVGQI